MARAPRPDVEALKRRLAAPPASAPAADDGGPRAATDHLLLPPDRIELDGPYVRRHVDPAELKGLADSIREGGDVRQAIGVRVEGPPLEPRYVLVYGMRRWMASRDAGLDRVPVRNHGRISVSEAVALQVAENEARVDPHPVDTAVSYQMLVEQGMTQAEVARLAGRSAAHVSYMRAVGEAIGTLDDEERDALYAAPGATVPRFQRIAPLPDVEARAAALRALLAADDGDGDAAPPPPPAPPLLEAREAKRTGAWTVRLRYRDDELRGDPELAARVERFLEDQLRRVREMRGGGGGPARWTID